MVPENIIDEFVKRFREAGGANVESIILFGSAVSGDFHAKLSNVNLFCVLGDSSFRSLRQLTPAAKWWDKQKQPPPLCMTKQELERSCDVFPIELLDMQHKHRVLFGEDVLTGLHIPMDLHRVQVEYELREKLILLRQHVLVASEDKARLWEVMQRSAPSMATLFRHALIALGETAPAHRRDAVEVLSRRIGADLSAVAEVLAQRGKGQPVELNLEDLAKNYLAAVEKVATAVDASGQ